MMRQTQVLLLVAALVCFPSAFGDAGENNRFSPLVESFAGGWIDWGEGAIYGIGRGAPHLSGGSRPMARRASKVLALQAILKIAAGISVVESKTLGDLTTGSRVVELEALIRFAEHRQVWVENVSRPYYETVLRAPMNGIEGLTARLFQVLTGRPPQQSPSPGPRPDADGPWLVLDARRTGRAVPVSPALFPRIVSEGGKTIYDLAHVEERALVERGMAQYVTVEDSRAGLTIEGSTAGGGIARFLSPAPAFAGVYRRSSASGPYVQAEVVSVRGGANTTLVISEEDARRIEAEDAFSRMLRSCRVMIVVPRPRR